MLLVVFRSILAFVDPYIFKILTDAFVDLATHGVGTVQSVLSVIIVWFIASMFFVFVYNSSEYSFYMLINHYYIRNLTNGFRRLMRKDISVFSKYKSGYVVDLMDRGHEALWHVNYTFIGRLAPSLLVFVVVVVFSFVVSWQLTLTLLVILPFQGLVSYYGYKQTQWHSKKMQKEWAKTFGVVGDVVQNIYASKAYATEKYELGRVRRHFSRSIKVQNESNLVWMWINSLNIRIVAMIAVWIVSAFLIVAGEITLGTVLMFTSLTRHIIDPIQVVVNQLPYVQRHISKHELMEKLLNDDETVVASEGVYSHRKTAGHYVLKNVSFSHGDRDTLKNVSLEIKKGEHVALVGPSGAGKSTLAFMLGRFYDPKHGSILLDGVDMREWDYDVLREHIAVVWQENMLFHESLKYNIAYGNRNASDREIKNALRGARIDGLVRRQKKGLRTMVGERGIKLSGGEKQRVMIARALLKNPDIVILDEATSALDSLTERDVQQGIERLIEGKTAVIIAHRLSTIKNCDRIYVMDKGRIVADGTHKQLVKSNELYRKMVHVQSDGMVG